MRRKVVFEREADGWWLASVPSVSGCRTQGRSLAQTRERIKEALTVSLDEPEETELVEEVKLPKSISGLLVMVTSARKNAETAEARALSLNAKAARALTGVWGVSLRDAAELLGLSHQRVAQILEAQKPARRVEARH
jgi:predicted RNase H-like HicB family nuclease